MTATASHSRLYAVGRLVLLVAAIALTVWGISLVAFSNSMRDTRVGIPIAFWGVLAGYAAIRMGNARAAGPAAADDGSNDATGEGAPASTELVRERDEAARREYEIRLELMLRRELEQGLREEMAALRRDVAELRGDVLDAVDGRLRMERVEITRIIGSNLAALHDDGRISLNPAAEVTVPAPGSADRPERARGADVDRDAPPSWTMPSTASAAEPVAQWAPRSVPDAAPGPGGWFDAVRDRPAPSAATPTGSSAADQADETTGTDQADETSGADQADGTSWADRTDLTVARSGSGVGSGEPFVSRLDAADAPSPDPAPEPDPGAATVEPGRVEAGFDTADPGAVDLGHVEAGAGWTEPELSGPVDEPAPAPGVAGFDAQASSAATAAGTVSAEVEPEIATEPGPRAVDSAPSTVRSAREDPFANLPRLSSFRLPDLPEGVTIAPVPEPDDPEPARPEPSIPTLEPARSGGGYVGRRRQGADEDAQTAEMSAGRHGARTDRGARSTSAPSAAPAPGSGKVPASRHRG